MAIKGPLHSPKLQHYWNLNIRLFSVISRTRVVGGGFTPLQRCSQCILQSQPTGQFSSREFRLMLKKIIKIPKKKKYTTIFEEVKKVSGFKKKKKELTNLYVIYLRNNIYYYRFSFSITLNSWFFTEV